MRIARQILSRIVRICLVTNTLSGGGAEKQLLLIARGLAQSGVNCGIYALRGAAAEARYAKLLSACLDAGVTLHVAQGPFGVFGIIGRLVGEVLWGKGRTLIWTWGYRAEILRLAVPVFWLAPGYFSLRSASVTQFHRWRWLLWLGRPLTRGYVSNSHLAVGLADRVVPGIGRKSRVVFNALEPAFMADDEALPPRPARLEVLMLGNVRFLIKGYDTALAVGALVKKHDLPIRIRIGGAQPPGEPDLATMIRQAQVDGVVEWVGPVVDPLAFLRGGNAFLLLSRYEGMPNALLEAMALGLPCVATDVGDLQRFETEMQGLRVVPVDDANAAFAELKAMWENWDAAVQMGRRGRRFCRENFSEQAMFKSVVGALGLPSAARVAGT